MFSNICKHLSFEQVTRLLIEIDLGKKIVMRKPPITCPACGFKILSYVWDESRDCFKHECTKCGEVMYG